MVTYADLSLTEGLKGGSVVKGSRSFGQIREYLVLVGCAFNTGEMTAPRST